MKEPLSERLYDRLLSRIDRGEVDDAVRQGRAVEDLRLAEQAVAEARRRQRRWDLSPMALHAGWALGLAAIGLLSNKDWIPAAATGGAILLLSIGSGRHRRTKARAAEEANRRLLEPRS